MGKHKLPRVGVTVQLVPGQDDDLIRWVSRLNGNKNQTVKDALRTALGLPLPIGPEGAQSVEVEQLKGQVAYLQNWLAKVADELPAYVHGEIERGLSGVAVVQNGAPTTGMISAPEETLPAEEIKERKSKLKRASW